MQMKKLIKNLKLRYDRAVGTRISYHLYKKFGNNKLKENTISLKLKDLLDNLLELLQSKV